MAKLSIMERAALERRSPKTSNVGTYNPNVSQHYRDANIKELETAKNYADLSRQWAIKMTGKVQDEDFSSKYYANESKKFASSIGDLASQVSKDAEQVAKDAAQVSQDASQVATDANQVSQDANQVSQDANQVSVDADQVAKDKVEVENNANQVAKDAAQVSDDAKFVHDFTVGPNPPSQLDTPSDTNNAYYYFQQVLNLTSGSISFNNKFTPTASKEYPDKTPTSGLWMIETTNLDNGYTFTTGNMKGFTCYTGDWFAYYKTPDVFEVLAVSPLHHQGLPSASEDKAGIAEIATQEEVDKGLDDSRFVTPLKLSKTKEEEGWRSSAQSGANMEAMRTLASNEFAASGFAHYGKHRNQVSQVVNEGMTTYGANQYWVDKLAMGYEPTGTVAGKSKTHYPVTHIAGFISQLRYINRGDNINTIKFPEAPNGTVIYDSSGDCRGSGKATLDLTKDIDPKYGNVAADTTEAVGRAFEGTIKNGNFRENTVSWGVSNSAIIAMEGDALRLTTNGSVNGQLFPQGFGPSAGINKIRIVISDLKGGASPVWQYKLGSDSYISQRLYEGVNEFTADFTGLTSFIIQPKGSATGSSILVHEVSVTSATEEVVINRVDMFGFEYFLEEVREVYPYGCIQSKADSIDGIPTKDSTRPDTYFAVFDGDTTSKGMCVVWDDLTAEQKIKIVSNPDHNLFLMDDGRLVQWRCRQRTIAGDANGDWANVNAANNTAGEWHLTASNSSNARVKPQGVLDSITASLASQGVNESGMYLGNESQSPTRTQGLHTLGTFTAVNKSINAPDTGVAINGECYFHVCGVVPRLNQGAYHPSFNPMGTSYSGTSNPASGQSKLWYHSDSGINSVVTAFTNKTIDNRFSGTLGRSSGRPDGKFYDAIYSSGQGGVIDYRLSAWDMSSKEEASKVFQKTVNGTYRGKEMLKKTVIRNSINERYVSVGSTNQISIKNESVSGSLDWLEDNVWTFVTGQVTVEGEVRDILKIKYSKTSLLIRTVDGKGVNIGDTVTGVILDVIDTNIPVSDNFLHIEVVGDPEVVLATPALTNGWIGSLNPKFNTNYNTITGSRKNVTGTVSRKYSDDSGVSWGSDSPSWDSAKNTFVASSLQPTGRVEMWEYTTFAKQTKEADVAPVFNGSQGIGTVFATKYSPIDQGCLLAESLIGKVPTDSTSSIAPRIFEADVSRIGINNANSEISSGGSFGTCEHTPIDLGAPQYDPNAAVKTLWYQTATKQQCSLNFAWNELKWTILPYHAVNETSIGIIQGHMYIGHGKTGGTAQYNLGGHIFKANGTNDGFAFRDMYMAEGGDIMYFGNTSSPSRDGNLKMYRIGDEWGDDSTIRIVDNTSTYVNLNGKTCLYGTSELSIPYGFSKNMARAGAQVSGVDLKTDLKGDLHVN